MPKAYKNRLVQKKEHMNILVLFIKERLTKDQLEHVRESFGRKPIRGWRVLVLDGAEKVDAKAFYSKNTQDDKSSSSGTADALERRLVAAMDALDGD